MPAAHFPVPTTLSSEFVLSPVNLDDIDDMISCHHAAFNTDEERVWWPLDLDAMRAWQHANMRRNIPKSDRRYFKITHVPSGTLVAWACWGLPKGFKGLGGVPLEPAVPQAGAGSTGKEAPDPVAIMEKLREDGSLSVEARVRKMIDEMKLPEGSSADSLVQAVVMEESVHERYNVSKDMIFLAVLCTHPGFERKGLAKALVQPMLVVAEAEELPVWVDSSPKGLGFYEKLGFETVEVTSVDLGLGNKGLTGQHYVNSMKWKLKSYAGGDNLSG